jgi:hypothetical protein
MFGSIFFRPERGPMEAIVTDDWMIIVERAFRQAVWLGCGRPRFPQEGPKSGAECPATGLTQHRSWGVPVVNGGEC